MKIANEVLPNLLKGAKLGAKAALLVALGSLVMTEELQAADMPPSMPPMAAPAAGMPAMPVAPPSSPPRPSMPLEEQTPGQDVGKEVAALEDKVSENTKATLKHFETSSDAMTLSDLNTIRQTVARIEAMIDVEKHLAELDKLRNERGHSGSAPSFAGAIPASALTPPPPPMVANSNIAAATKMHHASTPGFTISRIIGTEGRYAAVVKLASGVSKTVRVGDQIANGMVVRSISSSTLGVEEDGEMQTLHIENVEAIYSAMR